MKKSKILALALSAISTGILISCAKPANDAENSTKKDNKKSDSDKQTEGNKAGNQKSDVTDSKADKTTNTNTAKVSVVKALNLSEHETTSYLQHVSKDIIIPIYQDSAKNSKLLHDKAIEMCKSNTTNTISSEQIDELRSQWLLLAKSWAKAEAVNYGPAYDSMANLYINYFPDERGLIHKSIKALINDNPGIDSKQFVDESAIVQGIPALEDILYANDTLNKAQCNYLINSSAELERRLTDIANEWEKSGNTLLDTSNPVTGMNQYFNGLLFHIENLKSTGVDKPLAIHSNQKGHVPAHVAGQSKVIIKVKLDILQLALLDDELKKLVGVDNEANNVLNNVNNSLNVAQKQLLKLPEDISKADKNELKTLHENLTIITKHIKRGVMPLLSVQLGFNSTDGD